VINVGNCHQRCQLRVKLRHPKWYPMRQPLRFGELRSLTTPPKLPGDSVEQREVEADPEAAPLIRKYPSFGGYRPRFGKETFLT
jgi:hypothetical protein